MSTSAFTRNADTWERKSGGGCLTLFGLPFLVAGLAAMALGVGLIRFPGGNPPWFVVLPFGLVFAGVGSVVVFGRSGMVVNRRTRTLTTWRRVLCFSKTTERDISDFDGVALSQEVRTRHTKNGSQTYDVFPVRLKGAGEAAAISEHSDYQTARQEAEELARFLGLPLSDSTSGETVVREADALDASLRDRIRSGEAPLEIPEPPPEMVATFRVRGDMFRIDIPKPTGAPKGVGGLVAGVGFATFVSLVFLRPLLRNKSMPAGPKTVFVTFLGVFFIGLPLLAALWKVVAGSSEEEIIVSPRSLQVTKRNRLSRKTVQIPADELEELTLGVGPLNDPDADRGPPRADCGRGITARSDKTTVVFGAALSPEELRWVHANIQRVLSS